MQVLLQDGGATWRLDLDHPFDISRPLGFRADDPQPEAFYLPRAVASPVRVGGFVGDLLQGGSCRCETLTLTPHGNGTHTECAAHVLSNAPLLRDSLREAFIPAQLVTVDATPVIDVRPALPPRAVVVRTRPNPPEKQWARTSGEDPPYLDEEAAAWLAAQGVMHLLLDLPSADREDDGGRLAAHKAFFAERPGATITEMIYVDDAIPDGRYLLNLQIGPFMLDVSPSRPLLYRMLPHE